MAESTLSTSVSHPSMSRRSMVAGGAGVLAAPVLVLPAPARAVLAAAGPDSELLRRVALADRYRDACDAAEEAFERLCDALERRPEFADADADTDAGRALRKAIARRSGVTAAEAGLDRLYRRYEAAAEAPFDVPARTLPGLYVKTRLAVTVVKERHPWGCDHIDCACLDSVLADLDRLAAE